MCIGRLWFQQRWGSAFVLESDFQTHEHKGETFMSLLELSKIGVKILKWLQCSQVAPMISFPLDFGDGVLF